MVRPKLDYCVNVWKPATPGLQKLIEKVQKRAAGLVLGHRVEDYTRCISVLSWSPIHIRQTCQELCLMYKIINNLIDIDFMKYFTVRTKGYSTDLLDPTQVESKKCSQIQWPVPSINAEPVDVSLGEE